MYGQTQTPPADYYTAPCSCGFRRWGSHTQECADAAHGVTRDERGVAL
jgi:hypothetical protein